MPQFIRKLYLSASAALCCLLPMPTSASAQENATAKNDGTTNLFTNGSFELGLGAEPFYPGWGYAKGARPPLPSEVPPLPIIDETQAHSGAKSLKFISIPGTGKAVLEFTTPVFKEKTESYFSVWVKAKEPGVIFTFGVCPPPFKGPHPFVARIRKEVPQKWTKLECKVPALDGAIHVRAEIYSKSKKPFDVWIDDICYTTQKHQETTRAGNVEAILIPGNRNSMYDASKPLSLTWSADAKSKQPILFKLELQDLSRKKDSAIVWQKNVEVNSKAKQGKIELGKIKRGAYLATLNAYDPKSGKLIAQSRERFTVMTDLSTVKAPINFMAGYHGGLGFGKEKYYSWRGAWSLDEFFKLWGNTGLRVMRNIFRWSEFEPEKGKFTWDNNFGRLSAAATRNGCAVLPCVPAYPIHIDKKKYNKIIASDNLKNGYWLIKNCTDISQFSRRSAIMGWSKDISKRKILLAPKPEDLSRFLTAFITRYKDAIPALEFMNESNLYIQPKALVDYYFKPGYPVVKKIAPNLPVLMNQTMDYDEDGNGYTGQFFENGGAKYSDGFTHHPYGCDTLSKNGLEAVRSLETLAKRYSKNGKKMVLGMSEIHGIGCRNFVRTEAVQRSLLDWSIGCTISAGVILDGLTFYEGGFRDMWFRRGSFVPGVGAMEMNGMFAALAGAQIIKRIDLDDDTLIACFKTEGEKPIYTAAVLSADYPVRMAILKTDLTGLNITALDACAEPMKLSDLHRLQLTPDAKYLQSDSPELFKRLEKSTVVWTQLLKAKVEDNLNANIWAHMATNGMPPATEVNSGPIASWKKVMTKKIPTATGTDLIEKIIDAKGNLIAEAEDVNWADQLPYVPVSVKDKNTTDYLYTSISTDTAGDIPFTITTTGMYSIWVNGKLASKSKESSTKMINQKWDNIKLPMKKGDNNILIMLSNPGTVSAFTLKPGTTNNKPRALIDNNGYILKWRMIGPWNNPRRDGKFIGNQMVFPPEKTPLESNITAGYHGKTIRKNMKRIRVPLVWYEANAEGNKIPHRWINAISYGYTEIESPADINCFALVGSDDGFAMWLNGEEVGRQSISRALKPDQNKIPVHLKKGKNIILFKIEDTGAEGGYMLRFVDEKGTPIKLKVLQ